MRRCFYDNETTYHALAFVPGTNRVIILSKCHASMARDEKTRNSTDEGEPPKKKEYLLIMELFYDKTIDIEVGHNLGIFTHMGRSYCTACILLGSATVVIVQRDFGTNIITGLMKDWG